jgi:hypothetical protein
LFQADLTVDAIATDTVINVSSAQGFEIGDHIAIRDSLNSTIEGAIITDKNVTLKTITIAAPGLANGYAEADNVAIATLNFDLTLYRKDPKGLVPPVETWNFLSMGDTSNNFETILNDINVGSEHIIVEDVVSAETNVLEMIPYEIDAKLFFDDIAGTDGTAPINQDFIDLFSEYDEDREIRFLACSDNVSNTVNLAGESYCQARGDCIWYSNLPSHQEFSQLKVIGAALLGGETSYMFNVAQWLEVADPIGLNENAKKEVPNIGHILGHSIHRIITDGYQRVPAGPQMALTGTSAIVGPTLINADERTTLADTGINSLNSIPGTGIVLRNARMSSNDLANRWFNQRFMRIIYKKTFEESFRILENDSVGAALLGKIRTAMLIYLQADYAGTDRTGNESAFLTITKSDGTLSTFNDVVQVIVDESNNKLEDVLNGRVNVDLYFTPNPPAESIEIGVGISLVLSVGE